jgi:hypothetical protein
MATLSTDGERLSLSLILVLGLATGLLYFLLALGVSPQGTVLADSRYGLVSAVATSAIVWATNRLRLPKRLFQQPANRVIE